MIYLEKIKNLLRYKLQNKYKVVVAPNLFLKRIKGMFFSLRFKFPIYHPLS